MSTFFALRRGEMLVAPDMQNMTTGVLRETYGVLRETLGRDFDTLVSVTALVMMSAVWLSVVTFATVVHANLQNSNGQPTTISWVRGR